MYITKREKHEDTSLFIHSDNPNCFGDFVEKVLAPIPDVKDIWMFNLLNMKFFYIQESILDKWQRFVVTIKAPPNKFHEIYNKLKKLKPIDTAAPVYIAYTFHMFGDSIMLSFMAKHEKYAKGYVNEYINCIPGVLRSTTTAIMKEERLTSPESWKLYVKSNLLPREDIIPSNNPESINAEVN
jgi:hypothetical protein